MASEGMDDEEAKRSHGVRRGCLLFKFMEKYQRPMGVLVTSDTETSYEREGRKIIALPYWRYWTLRRQIIGNG